MPATTPMKQGKRARGKTPTKNMPATPASPGAKDDMMSSDKESFEHYLRLRDVFEHGLFDMSEETMADEKSQEGKESVHWTEAQMKTLIIEYRNEIQGADFHKRGHHIWEKIAMKLSPHSAVACQQRFLMLKWSFLRAHDEAVRKCSIFDQMFSLYVMVPTLPHEMPADKTEEVDAALIEEMASPAKKMKPTEMQGHVHSPHKSMPSMDLGAGNM